MSDREGPCQFRSSVGDRVADVCPHCGHNMVLHGGAGNPSLASCVICAALIAVENLSERP